MITRLRKHVRRFLANTGVWPWPTTVPFAREVADWVNGGCRGVAPHSVKMQVVRAHLMEHGLTRFVETGTYLGETLANVASTGVECYSIELSDDLHARALERFRDHANVRLIHGDSGVEIVHLLSQIATPTLFWLDGHYSAGITARGIVDTPISAELDAILRHPVKQHVILIDDARLFDGTNAYPRMEDLLDLIRTGGTYVTEISTDIIRLMPRA